MDTATPHTLLSSGPLPVPTAELWRSLSTHMHPPKNLKGLDALWASLDGRLRQCLPRRWQALRFAQRVEALDDHHRSLSTKALQSALRDLRDRFKLGRDQKQDLVEAFAAIREATRRTLGLHPYPVQLAAARVLMNGQIAELATGEGKTLSAAIGATIRAWRGHGCHVITVNDYLAERDAVALGPLYQLCGLTVASIQQEASPRQRQQAYASDITYLTHKEAAADFLRDRIVLGDRKSLSRVLLDAMNDGRIARITDRVVMRGLFAAIVDEADSVLIDESVTPLILSGESPNPPLTEAHATAARLADQLETPIDYRINPRWHEILLTHTGRKKIAELTGSLGGIWTGQRRSEELIHQALVARTMFLKDQHYVIQDDKVVIVDESTGRLMPDRSWRAGLHQAIEAKENLPIQPPKHTLARISFQKFFRLYQHLAGMTGTARESSAELWQIYRLPVTTIPTHRPMIRKQASDRMFQTSEQKMKAVVASIQQRHAALQPVLVGTRSVEASDKLSAMLQALQLNHTVLNAVKHEEEAGIVATAGQPGRITVATNMAGRGTDIQLHPDVRGIGGLHVIATERHASARIDRQLFGRAGRQGDPGSVEVLVSLDDELFQRHAAPWAKKLLKAMLRLITGSSGLSLTIVRKLAQIRAERLGRSQRNQVLQADEWLEEQLAFAKDAS